MLNSIKSKIIFAFSSIIFIFVSLLVFIYFINVSFTDQYKSINNSIVYEQSLHDNVWSLIEISYISFNTNDYTLFDQKLETIKEIKYKLDIIFQDDTTNNQETKLAYRSVTNSLNVVIESVEKTKKDFANNGGILGVSKSFQDTVSKFNYVKQNINNLLVLETKKIAIVTQEINRVQRIVTIVVTISTIIIIFFVIILISIFLRSITGPILYLSEVSKKISAGDMDIKIDEKLVNEKSEIGNLSSAFILMISKLKERINDFDIFNKKVSQNNLDLENSNKAILNILEDIEEDKINAERLAGDLEKFKLAVDNVSDQIIITDVEGIVIYGNKAVEEITGYAPHDALGKKAGVLWKMPMPENFYSNMWDIIKNQKKTFIGEIQNRRKNGEVYTAYISISSVQDKNSNIIYFVAIQRDISREKEVDKAKTEFVSLASHQLRTPLSAINWYTEMLLAGDAGEINEEQRKYLTEVAIGNKRMVDLVDDFLNVSRLDMGTLVIAVKEVDVVLLLKSVEAEIKPEIIVKELTVEESIGENVPKFQADEKILRMVYQNLISNAVKYTHIGGQVKINLSTVLKGQSYGDKVMEEDSLVFGVVDSGMGIPTDQQDKIFLKLFRADNAKESETEGTGLGLYVIKSITEQSGGAVWFKSEENVGSSFYVSFPLLGMKLKNKIV